MLNSVMGWHWSNAARRKKETANFLGFYAHAAGVRFVSKDYRPVRRLAIDVHGWPEGRLPDPDAFLKLFLDGAKRARLIVDDSQEWCHWDRPTVTRADRAGTTVTLEDLT